MKTYVFFIGGTGARVFRSMVMLMASGVRVNNGGAIVPIIIDYDINNGNLNQAKELLIRYKYLSEMACSEEGFFKQKLDDSNVRSTSAIEFDNDKKTFDQFLGLAAHKLEFQKLLESLYDDSPADNPATELHLDLSVGFKGNPNIGSVVFNDYFSDPKWGYESFKSDFAPGDRIFVIGSIFGGTGSSGIPQLIKRLELNSEETKIRDAIKGVCLVLPYFRVKPSKESAVDSNTFNSKTKAALDYYLKEINVCLDKIYYIASKHSSDYENHDGGEKQENKAHLVELIAAMSVFEFANSDFEKDHHANNIGKDPVAYEFGTDRGFNRGPEDPEPNETTCLDFLGFDISKPSKYNYVRDLNRFAYLVRYALLNIYPEESTGKPADAAGFLHGASYYKELGGSIKAGTEFGNKLKEFCHLFQGWCEEMQGNKSMKFQPYDFETSLDKLVCANNNTDDRPEAKNIDDIMKRALNEKNAELRKKGNYVSEPNFLRCAYNAGKRAAEVPLKTK